jgi:hypothetical protein
MGGIEMLWVKVGKEKKFADQCDRLAYDVAKTTKKYWGRWYLLKDPPSIRCLVTKALRPGGYSGGYYDIELSRIGPNGESDGGSYTWQEHLSEKNWIGQQGLDDFTLAVNEIHKTHPKWLHK